LLTERFDVTIGERARRAAGLQKQAANLARRCQRAADGIDLHDLRRRAEELAGRAQEAADAAAALREAVEAFAVLPDGGGPVAGLVAPVGVAAAADEESSWAAAFQHASADLGLAVTGAYPDYHLFPFGVHVRLREERVLFGRRASYRLRPVALAEDVRRERDRIFGGGFNRDRFGRSLIRAHERLRMTEAGPGSPSTRVRLGDVYTLFALGNFGRGTYTRDQFAFDLYRFRMGDMTVDGWRVVLTDQRETGGSAVEVPTGRGGTDRLAGLRLEAAAPLDAAALDRARVEAAAAEDGRG
jgi:hypothetical protein